MFLRLLLLLTIVPIVELTILLKLAERFSWGPTIALVLVTGVLGAWLARREGLKAFGRIQEEMARGEAPTGAMMDGFLILVAGVVLVTPGILTDLFGFALLIPPCRGWIRKRLAAAIKKRVVIMHQAPGEMFTRYEGGAAGGDDEFIDIPGTSRDAAESNDTPRIES
ncbi:MAG: FxsA family protein [Planctomycetes bacterium]|nr:FxsA family protein [Planctomycetota bacterium]